MLNTPVHPESRRIPAQPGFLTLAGGVVISFTKEIFTTNGVALGIASAMIDNYL